MNRVQDKIILYISSAILFVYLCGVETTTITILLIMLILSCANVILDSVKSFLPNILIKNTIFLQLISILLLLTIFLDPRLVIWLPLLLYDFHRYHLTLSKVACLGIILFTLLKLNIFICVIVLLACVISVLLSNYNTKLTLLSKEIVTLRDDSVEHKKLLEHHNQMLVEKQDAAVYTATLQERNRIAREIHDNVGHLLTRSILQTGAIKTINKDDTLALPIEQLNTTLNTAMTNIRNSVHDLHDEAIDLEAAIKEIISPIEQFKIQFDYDMGTNVQRSIKYAFIAITKEAITNCVKYSNGNEIHILLREHPGFYQLMIEDNGTNTDITESGIGLTNMTDRVKSIQGNIKIINTNGFRILITAPKEDKS